MGIQLFKILLKILIVFIVILNLTFALPITSKPSDENVENIEWSGWILMAQSQPYQERARKVTPKSIFVVPDRKKHIECPPGEYSYELRCVPIVTIDREKLLIEELTHLFTNGHIVFETETSLNNDSYSYNDSNEDENSSYSIINEEPFSIDENKNDNLSDAPLKFDIFFDSFPVEDIKNTTAPVDKISSNEMNKTITEGNTSESIKIASILKLNNSFTNQTDIEIETNTKNENENENFQMSTTFETTATTTTIDLEFGSTTEHISTTEVSEINETTTTMQIDETTDNFVTETLSFSDLFVDSTEEILSLTNQSSSSSKLLESENMTTAESESFTEMQIHFVNDSSRNDSKENHFDSSTETVRSNEIEPLSTNEVLTNDEFHFPMKNENNSSTKEHFPIEKPTKKTSFSLVLQKNSDSLETTSIAIFSSSELTSNNQSTTIEDKSTDTDYESFTSKSTTTVITFTTSTSKPSEFFWWLPSGWQFNASGEQSMLLRFWKALQNYRSNTK